MQRWSGVLIVVVGLAFIGACGRTARAGEPATLRLALMPSIPTHRLVQQFEPLVRYLERKLNHRVELVSAPSFAELTQRLLAYRYDLAQVAPHIALFAVRRAGWESLARTDLAITPVLITLKGSNIQRIAGLRGRRLALPDQISLVALIGEAALQQAGLDLEQDVDVVHVANHASVASMVLQGLADAGVMSSNLLGREPADDLKRLEVAHRFHATFGLVYMASPKLAPALRRRIKKVLLAMRNDPQGRDAFSRYPYNIPAPLDPHSLDAFTNLLPILSRRLGPKDG